MTGTVLQNRLRHMPRPGLPGMQPLDIATWLEVDEAYAGQMALRDTLLAERPDAVHALAETARPAAEELLGTALAHLPAGFALDGTDVTRPDGRRIAIDRSAPLMTLGRICQQDFCILEARAGEHVLTGAVLCFPASWTLAEKFLRPLTAIHDPVASYDDALARRVQRLFDAIHPDRPLWRANLLRYADPALHAPRPENAPRRETGGDYIRSERQCLLRLPGTRAVVFSIHTTMIRLSDLTPDQRAAP